MAESFSIDSENGLFERAAKKFPRLLSNKISKRRFNIRRKGLQVKLEDFLELCRIRLLAREKTFIADSMPLFSVS